MKYPASVFCQLLELLPKTVFARLVQETGAERHAKGFSSWTHLVAMLFCQMAGSKSLREITDGLANAGGKLNHLGVGTAPPRSTLAYANAHRPAALFRRLFYATLQCYRDDCNRRWRRQFRFKNPLLSLDASVIELCLAMFPWASFRRTKGAVKLHLLLDHDGYFPVFAFLSTGDCHELHVARRLPLVKGSIVAVDRGYTDYALFGQWTANGVYFVTRLKAGARYQVVADRERPPAAEAAGLRADQDIQLVGASAQACPHRLRLVRWWDARQQVELVFLTNLRHLAARTIAAIYQERWRIELFFKTLKQHLKIKTFVGTTPNALASQIWTALLAVLLLKVLHLLAECAWAFCRLMALLRLNLLSHRDLWAWLRNPLDASPGQIDLQIISCLRIPHVLLPLVYK